MSNIRYAQTPYEITLTLLCAAFSVGIAWAVHGGTEIRWDAPLAFSGDSIYYLLTTQRLVDVGGYFVNGRQGYPFGSYLFDFPGADGGSLLALWVAAKITGSAAMANNAYYLSGFALAAAAGMWTLRRFGVSIAGSFTCALLFSVLPFHFIRLPHLYYTWYFVVPLYLWYSFELYKGGGVFRKSSWRLQLSHCVLLVGLACFGVYYAFFGAMALVLGGLLGWHKTKATQPMVLAAIASTLVCFGVAINLAPNLALATQYGANEHLAKRMPAESEVYGLKVVQLLLPRPSHRNAALAEINDSYARNSQAVNENAAAALGFVGGLGLLVLLFAAATHEPRSTRAPPALHFLGSVCVAMLLFATVGGFSSLFAQLLSPQIRAWNRISIFIGFLSLAAIGVAVDLWFQRIHLLRRRAIHAMSFLMIGVFAVWDQTTNENPAIVNAQQSVYRHEKDYYEHLENSVPPGAAVYQLPFMGFPEAPVRVGLESYDLGKGFLFTRQMKWSFGAAIGRDGAGFFEVLETHPLALQLEVARFLGFSGLLVDRRGYEDRGERITGQSSQLLMGAKPIVDVAANLAYFSLDSVRLANSVDDLSPDARALLAQWGVQKQSGRIVFAPGPEALQLDFSHSLRHQLRSVKGMSEPEPWGTWTDGDKQTFKFRRTLPDQFVLKIDAKAFGPNVGQPVRVSVGVQVATFVPKAEMQTFSLVFAPTKSTDSITIEPPIPTSPRALGLGMDGRALGIGIERLSIE